MKPFRNGNDRRGQNCSSVVSPTHPSIRPSVLYADPLSIPTQPPLSPAPARALPTPKPSGASPGTVCLQRREAALGPCSSSGGSLGLRVLGDTSPSSADPPGRGGASVCPGSETDTATSSGGGQLPEPGTGVETNRWHRDLPPQSKAGTAGAEAGTDPPGQGTAERLLHLFCFCFLRASPEAEAKVAGEAELGRPCGEVRAWGGGCSLPGVERDGSRRALGRRDGAGSRRRPLLRAARERSSCIPAGHRWGGAGAAACSRCRRRPSVVPHPPHPLPMPGVPLLPCPLSREPRVLDDNLRADRHLFVLSLSRTRGRPRRPRGRGGCRSCRGKQPQTVLPPSHLHPPRSGTFLPGDPLKVELRLK